MCANTKALSIPSLAYSKGTITDTTVERSGAASRTFRGWHAWYNTANFLTPGCYREMLKRKNHNSIFLESNPISHAQQSYTLLYQGSKQEMYLFTLVTVNCSCIKKNFIIFVCRHPFAVIWVRVKTVCWSKLWEINLCEIF